MVFTGSSDHRSVLFRNRTEVWVRIEAEMRLAPNVAVGSKAEVAPGAEYNWRFLGQFQAWLDFPDLHSMRHLSFQANPTCFP